MWSFSKRPLRQSYYAGILYRARCYIRKLSVYSIYVSFSKLSDHLSDHDDLPVGNRVDHGAGAVAAHDHAVDCLVAFNEGSQ